MRLRRLLAGFLKPTDGVIKIDNSVVADSKKITSPNKRNIGMVFQSYALWPHMTVKQQVTFPMQHSIFSKYKTQKNREERTDAVLKLVNMQTMGDRYPSELSGGQKQRLATADALAGLPACLVLDEPTAMLDPDSRKEVINIVKELNRKEEMTIILITHHTDEVVDADRIVLMKDGKIIGDDIPKKIFADYELLKKAKMDIPPVVELGMRLEKQQIGLEGPVLQEQEMIEKIVKLYRSKCGGKKDAAR